MAPNLMLFFSVFAASSPSQQTSFSLPMRAHHIFQKQLWLPVPLSSSLQTSALQPDTLSLHTPQQGFKFLHLSSLNYVPVCPSRLEHVSPRSGHPVFRSGLMGCPKQNLQGLSLALIRNGGWW